MAYEYAGGFMGGLAQGLQQGTNMGYIAMQSRAIRDNQIRQAQMMQMEREKLEWERKNAEIERAVSVFNNLPKRLRGSFYSKNLAPMFKQVYNIDMDPSLYNDNIEKGLEDFNALIKLRREGKLTQSEFLTQAAEIRSMVTKEESDQMGSILDDMPGGSRNGKQGFSIDALMSPQETMLFYKIQLGLKDDEIDAAIKSGKYPKQLRQGAAQMLKKGGTDWAAIGAMLGGIGNADSVANKNGF